MSISQPIHFPNPRKATSELGTALQGVEEILREVVDNSDVVAGMLGHLVFSGGKRIRPRLVLLSYGLFASEFSVDAQVLAASAELIHTASLLHDDVIDESDVRRNRRTVRAQWSNPESVLAGNHCLVSAMRLIRSVDPLDTLSEALDTVQELVRGELKQLEVHGQFVLDEKTQALICEKKTASLFRWCARAGARSAGASSSEIDRLAAIAGDLGIAFQFRDDLLDLRGHEGFGKKLFEDLKQGRTTMPLIYALREAPEREKELRRLFESEDTRDEDWERVRDWIMGTRAVARTRDDIHRTTDEARRQLLRFEPSECRELLRAIVELIADI